ncbi:cell cycle checkpoint protein RAD17 [Orussus abietinus]|uniref:cell cycle checkpoint protein RAD17 n=1 Tax=Orussus abietinus TaxID=222816 RepID=UPI00062568FC|nr:cell cycle checkpoint protein RAD17 [Orussus abietinus]
MEEPKKRNSSWLKSSFDFGPSKKPLSHRHAKPPGNSNSFEESVHVIGHQQHTKNVTCLNTLLLACEPQKALDLAISRQKQNELKTWLQTKSREYKPCILIISGPSGCGKTMGFKILAKENGYDIVEWVNPVDQLMAEDYRVMRQADKFEDFLIRATRYNSVFGNSTRRVLLIKDFPNVFTEDKESFYAILEKYYQLGKEPLVLICTDSKNYGILQILFPPHVMLRFHIDHISINPVTQASMKNVMKRVSTILASKASHILNVTQETVNEVLASGIGDVRNILLRFIFSSIRVSQSPSNNQCTNRANCVSLLHGIGQVIYPKRVVQNESWTFVHTPEEIAQSFAPQSGQFYRFLHENYLNTMTVMEKVELASEVISMADCMLSEWRDFNLMTVALTFCIRGIMLANDVPNTGWKPVRKPQYDDRNVRRDLAEAEVKWYQSIISSATMDVEESPNLMLESVIV